MAGNQSRRLANVAAVSAALSDTGGRAGRLSYRGSDISELAGATCLIRPDSEDIGKRGRPRIPLEAR